MTTEKPDPAALTFRDKLVLAIAKGYGNPADPNFWPDAHEERVSSIADAVEAHLSALQPQPSADDAAVLEFPFDGWSDWRPTVNADLAVLRSAGHGAIADRIELLAQLYEREESAWIEQIVENGELKEQIEKLKYQLRTPEQIAADEKLKAERRERIATYHRDVAGQPYRPSNGTEGMHFEAHFCNRCTKEGDDERGYCEIASAVFCREIGDPAYPAERKYAIDGSGPTCMAFQRKPE